MTRKLCILLIAAALVAIPALAGGTQSNCPGCQATNPPVHFIYACPLCSTQWLVPGNLNSQPHPEPCPDDGVLCNSIGFICDLCNYHGSF